MLRGLWTGWGLSRTAPARGRSLAPAARGGRSLRGPAERAPDRGGFDVPGSGSQVVDRNLDRFEDARSRSLAVVLARKPGATTGGACAEVDRVDALAKRLPHVELSDTAARRAKQQAGDASIVVVPLEVNGNLDESADLAVNMRDELLAGNPGGDRVDLYLVGQQALWAGMQDLSKEDPRPPRPRASRSSC